MDIKGMDSLENSLIDDSENHHSFQRDISFEEMKVDSYINIFLTATFLLDPKRNQRCWWLSVFSYWIYFIISFFGLLNSLFFSGMYVYYRGSTFTMGTGYPSHLQMVFYVLVFVAVLLELIVFVFGVYTGRQAISKGPDRREMGIYRQIAQKCLLFYGGFFFVFACGVGLYPYNYDEVTVFAASAIGGTIGIVINMFFVTVNCRSASAAILELTSLVDNRKLSMETVKRVRGEVKSISDYGFIVNSIMALSAVMHGVVFVVGILSVDQDHSITESYELVGRIIVYAAIFLKEIVYLAIILFEIAAVNEHADQLQASLTESCWISGGVEMELERHSLCISLARYPISFQLFYSRPTRVSVFLQLATYVLSLVVSTVVKTAA